MDLPVSMVPRAHYDHRRKGRYMRNGFQKSDKEIELSKIVELKITRNL